MNQDHSEHHLGPAARGRHMIQSADIAMAAVVRVQACLHIVLRHVPQRDQYKNDQQQAQATSALRSFRNKSLSEHARYHTAF